MMYRKGKMISVAILNVLLLAAPIATQELTVKADELSDNADSQLTAQDKARLAKAGEANDFNTSLNTDDTDGSVGAPSTATASGKLGDVEWNLTNDGVLHIQGGQLPAMDENSITSPFSKYADSIKTVSFDGKTTADSNSRSLFKGLKYLENIANPENFDTSKVTDMSGMFDNTGLKDLSQVGKLNVDNVTKMDAMFANTPITDLTPISGWNVSKVTSANGMFSGSKITSLKPLSNWQPTSLNNGEEMFSSTPITSLDGLQNWQPNNLNDMTAMFYNDKISDLSPVSNWNVSQAQSMTGLFAGTNVSNLTPISKWNTSAATDMSNMFAHTKVNDVTPIANWDTSKVESIYGMLSNTNLNNVSGLNWDLASAKDISGLLSNNANLEKVDLSSLKNANAMTDISEMFANDPILNDVDLSSLNTGKVDTSDDVFKGDNSLTKINFGANFKLSNSTVTLPTNGSSNAEWLNEGDKSKKISPDGISATDSVQGTYTLDTPSVTKPVTISSNIGDVQSEPTTGKEGQIIFVNVPDKPGYTTDTKKVRAKVNDDGTITALDKAEYTKIGNSSNGNSGNTTHTVVVNHDVVQYVDKPTIVHEPNLVSTHFNQNYFNLYKLEDNTMVKSGTRALAKGTDWFSDEITSVDGEEYYRVATNEWIKANDVYVYIPSNRVVTIKNDRTARLKDAQDDLIGNRALGSNSSWKSDRVTKFNNKTYYRVATNEFASIDDIK
ncbi:BspA family leucine-rich repeat surface protein [Companilactobacillus mindensis]|uniref:BspA family leucine-rich repeat surface protein n=1 Tax=Companilactobacillus mindensis TaxID=167481 RepID=UPI00070A1C83|nr:BspA family leucine-rich repeat surface protein [Companilactobacillus mindensis]GEO78833.1 hypothetical protein LMI01_11640 [Companilactobacillus mindensis]